MPTTTPAAADADFDAFSGYAYYDAVARAHDNKAIQGSELGQMQSEILLLIALARNSRVKVWNATGATLQKYHAVGIAGWNVANTAWSAVMAHPGDAETDPIPCVGFPVAAIANGAAGYIQVEPDSFTTDTTGGGSAGDPLYLVQSAGSLGGGNIGTGVSGSVIIQKLGALQSIDASGVVRLRAQAPVMDPGFPWVTKDSNFTIVRARGECYRTTAGRTGGSTLTLPAVRAGALVRIASTGAAGAKVATPSAGIYIAYADNDSSYTNLSCSGNGLLTLACDGAKWFVAAVTGNWTPA